MWSLKLLLQVFAYLVVFLAYSLTSDYKSTLKFLEDNIKQVLNSSLDLFFYSDCSYFEHREENYCRQLV